MRRPRLTPQVIEGLLEIRALVDVELCSGEMGSFDEGNGGPGSAAPKCGLEYIDALICWYRQKSKVRGKQ